jgi:pimeloyl-ACP methyl ester carboxylesterase/nicotinamidase-related amidase
MKRIAITATLIAAAGLSLTNGMTSEVLAEEPDITATVDTTAVRHRTMNIDGLDLFYREAGPIDAPTIVLLHGFPTSSHMFRDLIPQLADKYHVVAPDYPGYGSSSAPSIDEWEYTFDNVANTVDTLLEKLEVDSYTLYVMDYGAPIGFRIATAHPERVEGLIVQNGNAYDEGLRDFWVPIKKYWADPSAENGDALRGLLTIDATKWQYTEGTRNPELISPDNWLVDQPLLDRPGNQEIQLAMFLDYGSNPPLYPQWQEYFRTHQPPTLIVWGENDVIFPADGAHPYLNDLPRAELHLFDTGHFALEEDGDVIAKHIRSFMQRKVVGQTRSTKTGAASDEAGKHLGFNSDNVALVITDPQNDFLSPDGVTWGLVGESVTENNTVENIDRLFAAAKNSGVPVFVSPHYYYPHDHQWEFEGKLEAVMHQIGMFDRHSALSLEDFKESGADWLDQYKHYIEDGKTVVTSPHKVYGPETNDLVLQLRKRGIDRVILGGMSANLCTESHMRELIEQGFDVVVVSDATAAAQGPLGDGYASALINFQYIAGDAVTTEEAVEAITDSAGR